MLAFLKRILSFIICGIFTLGASWGWWPYRVTDEKIDLSAFDLVFEDEFDGDTLDEVWRPHHFGNNGTIKRRGSYWNRELASVRDGELHIEVKYLENGVNPGDEAGWYTAGIDTNGTYSQTFGYFETRCILPSGYGLWSAFWMLSPGMNDSAASGIEGAEIDIFESAYYSEKRNNMVSSCVHIRGYGDNHQSSGGKRCIVQGNPYKEYNTYGVEWNKDGYTFYINGQKYAHTNFGGASQSAEYMILSIEIGGENAVPSSNSWAGDFYKNPNGTDFTSDFVIDYVRAYQYK